MWWISRSTRRNRTSEVREILRLSNRSVSLYWKGKIMEDLTSWMKDFENEMISYTESVLDVINQESSFKIRDLSELSEEKVA